MKNKMQTVLFAVIFLLSGVAGYFGVPLLLKPSEPVADSEPVSVSDSIDVPKPLFVYDTVSFVQNFRPSVVFFENFNASYRDSSFFGVYQLAFPVESVYDSLRESKFNRLLLSMLFGEHAPKAVNRKSIQAALDRMMKGDVDNTHAWWRESKATYGKNWRDEVCICWGFFYAMPTDETPNWISFQQIQDYRCGGNGGPEEKYYTIIKGREPYMLDSMVLFSGKDTYVMDTTAFIPGFREELYDMITDNVIFNFYPRETALRLGRDEIRRAVAEEFKEDFQPSLTLFGVKFVFSTWGLPNTCHADGRVPVVVPYGMIQKIFTQKFKNDIGL